MRCEQLLRSLRTSVPASASARMVPIGSFDSRFALCQRYGMLMGPMDLLFHLAQACHTDSRCLTVLISVNGLYSTATFQPDGFLQHLEHTMLGYDVPV